MGRLSKVPYALNKKKHCCCAQALFRSNNSRSFAWHVLKCDADMDSKQKTTNKIPNRNLDPNKSTKTQKKPILNALMHNSNLRHNTWLVLWCRLRNQHLWHLSNTKYVFHKIRCLWNMSTKVPTFEFSIIWNSWISRKKVLGMSKTPCLMIIPNLAPEIKVYSNCSQNIYFLCGSMCQARQLRSSFKMPRIIWLTLVRST